jgi:hypothetical protein
MKRARVRAAVASCKLQVASFVLLFVARVLRFAFASPSPAPSLFLPSRISLL